MIIKPEGDIRKVNFWEINPTFQILCDNLYNTDKSKNKDLSSKIMWAFYLAMHPDSDFYNLSNKRELIVDKFLKLKGFSWDKYTEEESVFKEHGLSQAQRSLYDWNEYMKDRTNVLKSTPYILQDYIDKDGNLVKATAEQLDKAWGVTPKMYSEYDKIQKSLKEEEYKTGRGNKIKSLTDAKEI